VGKAAPKAVGVRNAAPKKAAKKATRVAKS